MLIFFLPFFFVFYQNPDSMMIFEKTQVSHPPFPLPKPEAKLQTKTTMQKKYILIVINAKSK